MLTMQRVHLYALAALLAVASVAVPAFSQTDLSGGWNTKSHKDVVERTDGPEIGDYTGLPINDAARMRADTWDAEEIETFEHICQKHSVDYAPRGPSNLRMWAEMDPFSRDVTAWRTEMTYMLPERTIYMDGRPHPSEFAPHTTQGFSTGVWEGDKLKITTTHLKESRIRRNGVPRSANATYIEYFIRHHGILTMVTDIEDPVYLTEPLVRSMTYIYDENFKFTPRHEQCIPSVTVPYPKGFVAFHLPGENSYLTEFASRYNVPVEAARGGAETMYPEYRIKLATMPPPPPLRGEKH
jgi:hypothetical protein